MSIAEVDARNGPATKRKASNENSNLTNFFGMNKIARIFVHGRNAIRDIWGTNIESETEFMRTTTVLDSSQVLRKPSDGKNTNISFFGEDSDTDSFGAQLVIDPAQSLWSSDEDEDDSDCDLGLIYSASQTPATQRRKKKIKNIGNFLLGPKLGEGAYAVVKEGLDQTSLRIVAVKILDLRRLRKISGGRENLEREIHVQRALKKHENIIELIQVIEDEPNSKCYLFLEMASGCTVQELLDKTPNRRLPESQVKYLMRQMMNGIIYMHGRNVVHRDIKPSNLMLTASSKLKISDFGVAEFLDAYAEGDNVTRTAGSPAFQAPEIANGDSDFSGIKVDVWASGVTMYYLLIGDVPFKGDNFVELFANISKAEISFPAGISKDAQHLIGGMLQKDWEMRLSPQEVLKHHWFKEDAVEFKHDWAEVPHRTFRIMETLNQMYEDDEEVAKSPAVQQLLGKGSLQNTSRRDTPVPKEISRGGGVRARMSMNQLKNELLAADRSFNPPGDTEQTGESPESGEKVIEENDSLTSQTPVPTNKDGGWLARVGDAIPVETSPQSTSRCIAM